MYNLFVVIGIVSLLILCIYAIPFRVYRQTFFRYAKFQKKLKRFSLQKLQNITHSQIGFIIFLVALYYYTFPKYPIIVQTVSIIVLFLLMNFRWIVVYHQKIYAIKNKHKVIAQNYWNQWILSGVQNCLMYFFTPILYFSIGGLPLTLLYFYYVSVKRDSTSTDIWLYLPTRLYWLLLIVMLWLFTRGFDIQSSINYQDRHKTNTLNATWLPSLIAGMCDIQLQLKQGNELILIGQNPNRITKDQLHAIFFSLILFPICLLF